MSFGKELKHSAALGALERLHAVAWQNDVWSFYAPLAETLAWITALAEASGRKEEPVLSGLAYARNALLHNPDSLIVSYVAHQDGFDYPLAGPTARIYVRNGTMWGFTQDPEPYDPSTGKERNAKRRADYNRTVANHEVLPLLDATLWDLGVNVLAMDDDDWQPAPRRARKQVTRPDSQ